MSLVSLVGLVACALFVAELAPQPLRIWRTRSLDGISATGSGITLVTEVGWLIYGIGGGYTVVTLTAIVAGSLKLWQFALTQPHWTERNLRLVVAWSLVVIAGALTGTLGFVLVGGLLLGLGPQAVAVVRSPSIAGVSVWRWWLALCSGSAWAAYGLLSGALAVATTGAAGVCFALLALQRIHAGTDRSPGSPHPARSPGTGSRTGRRWRARRASLPGQPG
jgi:uncharacterized protein with PQ loop repeat